MEQNCAACRHFNDMHLMCKAIIVNEQGIKYFQPAAEVLGENCKTFQRWNASKENVLSWFLGR